MGSLVDGQWVLRSAKPTDKSGRFRRRSPAFRRLVTADGGSGFKAEPGRYHLYISWACPWAHRTVIVRKLKGLEEVVSLSVVDHFAGDLGWEFTDRPGAIPDSVNGFRYLYEAYQQADPAYTGRVTVPALWDRETRTVVNNESADIIRMFNSEFDAFGRADRDFYPADLRAEIEAVNPVVYSNVNNGVYKAGFARTQEAYEEAANALFDTLDDLETRLGRQRFLAGDRVTEADWRLLTTLLRFDLVYHVHFKCNRRALREYPNLWAYTRQLYQLPAVAETTNFDHIVMHYYQSHTSLNPKGIVPIGPELDWWAPHDRGPVF